jgi:hypothetical protein
MGRIYRQSLDRVPRGSDEYVLPPCSTVDPDMFVLHRTINRAKQICMTCDPSLRKDCLRSAMKQSDDPGGVYGGLSQEDRTDLRKRLEYLSSDLKKNA